MVALRKQKDRSHRRGGAQGHAPEAFEYADDVTPETVKSIQDKADKTIREEDWVVIDGHVGKK